MYNPLPNHIGFVLYNEKKLNGSKMAQCQTVNTNAYKRLCTFLFLGLHGLFSSHTPTTRREINKKHTINSLILLELLIEIFCTTHIILNLIDEFSNNC